MTFRKRQLSNRLEAFCSDSIGSLKIEMDENFGGDDVLDSKGAADFLKISIGRLRNLTSNGHIPRLKLGRSNRYLKSVLRKVLLAQTRGVPNYVHSKR